MGRKVISIDMGGTNLRVARIEDGQVLQQVQEPCQAQGTEAEVLRQFFTLIEKVMTPGVERIGIGVPSVVDYEKGVVYNVQNIPSWKEVHLKEIIERRFGIETWVDNDVNCFILGEKVFGAAKGVKDAVGITLGTGVGAGILIDGKVYHGKNTGAGEIGCLPYLDLDYEQYCSSQYFNRLGTSGAELSERVDRGDGEAQKIWNDFGHHLGKLLQAVLFTYDPEMIVIGGGIAKGARYFSEAMMESMKNGFPYPLESETVKVVFSSLADCNMLGASQL